MRRRKNRSDAGENIEDAGTSKRRQRGGRGWGPFSSNQLTVIVCVAIVSAILIPTAAMAAVGTFTSTTVTPAVTGTNSATVPQARGVQGTASATSAGVTRYGVTGTAGGTFGIGVVGTGTKYGVFSNGPIGVAAGNSLNCTGCIGPTALSAAAKAPPNLGSGESESGMFDANGASSGDLMLETITFTRPLATTPTVVYTSTWPVDNCAGPGQASPGYLCLYLQLSNAVSFNGWSFFSSPYKGLSLGWHATDIVAYVVGDWTVTAP